MLDPGPGEVPQPTPVPIELVTTITGLSAVGAAAILAEAGDPARCLYRHLLGG
jgi:transposase